ncbi:MAG: hypothetical protein FI682_03070 [SAR202 cluster bacterium]|nr:hypothetical protein [SAR202 cluster bacterium]|tara:strand:- start:1947 stop:3107 length:1161 start_codon:yes stop_codon:yes gene_type:complete
MSNTEWGSIYKDLGLEPIINATGSVTALGGSVVAKEVQEGMDLANDVYIPMTLLEQKVGDQIAKMLDVPAAYITSGAGSALTLAAASFMAGKDDDKIQQLPDTSGMPNKILIQKRQRYWYDRCMELSGGKLVEVGDESGTTSEQLREAIDENTACVHYPVYEQDDKDPNILSLEEVIEITHSKNKPVSVDAAGQIYPLENFGKYVKMGADFQCIAAKYMGAPHSTGIAIGTKDVIDSISRHSFVGYESRRIRGIGRPHKIDRQEIIGVLYAVKRWMSMNHEERLSIAEKKTFNIINELKNIEGITVKLIDNIIGHQPFGLSLDIDDKFFDTNNEKFVEILKNSDPQIWTRVPDGENTIVIHVFGMTEEQSEIVSEVIKKELEVLKR